MLELQRQNQLARSQTEAARHSSQERISCPALSRHYRPEKCSMDVTNAKQLKKIEKVLTTNAKAATKNVNNIF
jgi:hypothetical protein